MKLSNTVQILDGTYVWIDTCYTMDHGYETMVFRSDSNGKVTNWTELDMDIYVTDVEATQGHANMVKKWKNVKSYKTNDMWNDDDDESYKSEEGGDLNNTTEYGATEKSNKNKLQEKNIMTKKEYAEVIANAVDGVIVEVEKANGIVHTGIRMANAVDIDDSKQVTPIVYIDMLFDEDTDIEDAIKYVKNGFNNVYPVRDVDFISDFEKVAPRLRVRLYNKKTNAEIYKSAKEYGYDDLIIVPYIEFSCDENGVAASKISTQLLKMWGVSEDVVFLNAFKNTREQGIYLKSMLETLIEMMGRPKEELEMMGLVDNSPMYVLTNPSKAYGAINAIVFKEELKERFPKGYVVIPSSVHEVIIIPKDLASDTEMLNNLINDVNTESVAPEERLGDKIYIF